jgi:nicotinamidase-related amidase
MANQVNIDPRSTGLVIVDMQHDFVDPTGALYVGASIGKIIKPLQSLLNAVRKKRMPVIYTQDWHTVNDREFKIWPKHCVKSTPGAQVIDELKPTKGSIRIRKVTYDPWFDTDMDRILSRKHLKNLIVTGTVSNICVMHTVGGAALRGYRVTVPEDCVAALSPEDQAFALKQFQTIYQAKIVKSEHVIKVISKS